MTSLKKINLYPQSDDFFIFTYKWNIKSRLTQFKNGQKPKQTNWIRQKKNSNVNRTVRKSIPPSFYADFSPRGNNTRSTIGDNGPFPHTSPLWRHSLHHSSTSLFFSRSTTPPWRDRRLSKVRATFEREPPGKSGRNSSLGSSGENALAVCCPRGHNASNLLSTHWLCCATIFFSGRHREDEALTMARCVCYTCRALWVLIMAFFVNGAVPPSADAVKRDH